MKTGVELLQRKFRDTGYSTVSDWMRENKVDLSLQSCTTVLLRGVDKGLIVMLTLAAALNCTAEEIKMIAQEKGDDTLWRLITTSSLSREEMEILELYRSMSGNQKKVVLNVMREMGSKA